MSDESLQPIVGHVHLTVSDLDRSVAFYRDLLGLDVSSRYGESAIFLSSGGYHHHVGLNTWAGKGAVPPPKGHTGLYHVAFLYPSRKALAHALSRLMRANYPIDGTADHGVSEAIYLRDPDENGIEIYVDRPRNMWVHNEEGLIEMHTQALDIDELLKELN